MVIMIIAWMFQMSVPDEDDIAAGYLLFNILEKPRCPSFSSGTSGWHQRASEISSELSDSFGFRFLWVSWWVTPRVNVWIALAEYMCLYWFNL